MTVRKHIWREKEKNILFPVSGLWPKNESELQKNLNTVLCLTKQLTTNYKTITEKTMQRDFDEALATQVSGSDSDWALLWEQRIYSLKGSEQSLGLVFNNKVAFGLGSWPIIN